MTGIVVGDSYQEAKESGINDFAAAAFTLGHAAGEWAILSTELGKWILPELKLEKGKIQEAIRKTALGDKGIFQLPDAGAAPEVKRKWFQKILDVGKKFGKVHASEKIARREGETLLDRATKAEPLKLLSGQMAANALGEGVEEVTEELVADLGKTLFNAGSYLIGSDQKFDNAIYQQSASDIFNRYAANFIGGVLGGGLANTLPNFRLAQSIAAMNQKEAWSEVVHQIQ